MEGIQTPAYQTPHTILVIKIILTKSHTTVCINQEACSFSSYTEVYATHPRLEGKAVSPFHKLIPGRTQSRHVIKDKRNV